MTIRSGGLTLVALLWAAAAQAAQPSGATPRGNPGEWITTADYPARALRAQAQGTTGFRVTIDAAGRVTGCVVTASSGSADLDAATCTLFVERARFFPATDKRGRPVEGAYSTRVRWKIPLDTPASPGPLGPLLTVDANGNVVVNP